LTLSTFQKHEENVYCISDYEKIKSTPNQDEEISKSLPPSAYEIFSFEKINFFKKNNPDKKEEDIKQLLALTWRYDLKEEEKIFYQNRSFSLWKKHDKKVKKIQEKQISPPSSYKLFAKDKIREFKGLSKMEMQTKCILAWNVLSEEERGIYQKMSLQLWKKYGKQLNETKFDHY
jgi:hypothetical protein